MMNAFDIRNMLSLLRWNKTPAELHHAGFIYYCLYDARNHENQIVERELFYIIHIISDENFSLLSNTYWAYWWS